MGEAAPNFEDIVARLRRTVPGLEPSEQRHALMLLRTLARGEPVPIAVLAERTGMDRRQAEAFLERLRSVYRDDEGRVIGFWGLTVAHMPPHRYRVNGTDLYTWCAWDPLLLTPWLGGEAEVRSVDARSGEEISFRVAEGDVVDLSHAGVTLSFTLPDEWSEDVISTFCHLIHFFTDETSAATWTRENLDTFVLPLADAVELGRVWGRHVLPDLDPAA